MTGIAIENVSKNYSKTTRKLWFRNTEEDKPNESNVSFVTKNRYLYHSSTKTTQALDNINLDLQEGDIIGLLGPNGAGKTTLAKIMSTLVLPDSGTVKVNGYDIERETVKARFSLGLVTGGERSLYWKLTPAQNLRFFGSLYGMTAVETIDRAKYLMKIFGLEQKKDTLVQDLSTGYKMKTAFARSLMHDPPIMILDEYNRGLDPRASRELRQYIKEELQGNQQKTMIIMTHNMEIAENLCDRIVLIDEGKIVAKGTPASLKGTLVQKQIVEIETMDDISNGQLEPLLKLGDLEYGADSTNVFKIVVDKTPDSIYQILQQLHSSEIVVKNFNLSNPNLEDVFTTYTGKGLEDD